MTENMADVETMDSVKKETVDSIVAELCAATQSIDIKNCVQCYEYRKTVQQIKQELMKFKKASLQATFEHLKWPHESMPRTKPEIVNDIVCRIQNFLPETCGFCNQSYRTKHGDDHLLSCAICGQEAHLPCLLKKLRLEPPDRPSYKVAKLINPYGFKGLQYICPPCDESNIPGYNTDQTSSHALDGNMGEVVDTSKQYSKTAVPSINIVVDEKREDGKFKAVCKFYNHGLCKHGKKGANCKYSHPPLCDKLIKHGCKASRGCKLKADECSYHHPIMCKNSITRGFCYKKNCTRYHVQGTKRNPDRNQSKFSEKGNSNIKSVNEPSRNKESGTNGDFLDYLKKDERGDFERNAHHYVQSVLSSTS